MPARPVIVHVGSVLFEYTRGRGRVEARGSSVRAVLADLDAAYPGLAFRVVDEQDSIRPHMRIYLGETPVTDLGTRVRAGEEIHILGALSGG